MAKIDVTDSTTWNNDTTTEGADLAIACVLTSLRTWLGAHRHQWWQVMFTEGVTRGIQVPPKCSVQNHSTAMQSDFQLSQKHWPRCHQLGSLLQAHSKPVVDAVQVMASVIEHFEALHLPNQQEESSAAADLVWARSLWNSLTGSIFSSSALISAAALDEASGHSGVLHFINQCIELSHYVDGFQQMIHRLDLCP